MEENKKRNLSFAEEADRERKYWKRNHLWTLLLVAAVVIGSMFFGSDMSVTPGTSELTLTMDDGAVHIISYQNITDAVLLEQADYGVCIAGHDGRKEKTGTWEQELWGEYTLCVYTSSRACIVLTCLDGSVYVTNFASDSETQQLYEIIATHAAAG